MKDLQHSNICSFVGACFDGMELILLTELCSRGSLMVRVIFSIGLL